jgi:hypothetical protein
MRADFVLYLSATLLLSPTAQARPAVAIASSQESAVDAERTARAMIAASPASPVGRALLAEALAKQSRWKEAVDTLLEGSRLVAADERVRFGMVMGEFAQARPEMPLAEARRLFQAADAVAGAVLAKAPNDRDALMLHGGATGMLAERLPAGPEKSRLEKTSKSAIDRFMALAPKRAEESAFVDPRALPPPQGTPAPPPSQEETRKSLDAALIEVRASAAAKPANDDAQVQLAAYLFDVVRDAGRPEPARLAAVDEGLRAVDVVVKRNADHVEALVYRKLLLTQSAALQTSPARRDALLAEAAEMEKRALEARKRKSGQP